MASQIPEDNLPPPINPTPPPPPPPPDPTANGTIARIRNLILAPNAEWRRIDAEPMTVRGIMTGWVLPLAAIGPVARLIGSLLFGYHAFGVVYRPGIAAAVTTAVTSYVLAIVGVYVSALIFDALAPSFGGTRNPVQAMKAAAFSSTAAWVAGILTIIPMLGFLAALLGLYSLYLLFVGLPLVMRVPEAKKVGYVVVSIVAAVVVFLVVGAIAGAIGTALFAPTLGMGTGGTLSVG